MKTMTEKGRKGGRKEGRGEERKEGNLTSPKLKFDFYFDKNRASYSYKFSLLCQI